MIGAAGSTLDRSKLTSLVVAIGFGVMGERLGLTWTMLGVSGRFIGGNLTLVGEVICFIGDGSNSLRLDAESTV